MTWIKLSIMTLINYIDQQFVTSFNYIKEMDEMRIKIT